MYPKCKATGKMAFPSQEEARRIMFQWRRPCWNELTGMRIKHWRGRPLQKRVYQCPHCKDYHLTKWDMEQFKKYHTVIMAVLNK